MKLNSVNEKIMPLHYEIDMISISVQGQIWRQILERIGNQILGLIRPQLNIDTTNET
jgi:hypothetical protein